jgi:hypothetical protein
LGCVSPQTSLLPVTVSHSRAASQFLTLSLLAGSVSFCPSAQDGVTTELGWEVLVSQQPWGPWWDENQPTGVWGLDSSCMNLHCLSGLRHVPGQLFTHGSPEHLLHLRHALVIHFSKCCRCQASDGGIERKKSDRMMTHLLPFRSPQAHPDNDTVLLL